MAGRTSGSSNFIRRAIFADFDLSMDRGETTDKGTINQRMVLENHQDVIERLYAEAPGPEVMEVEADYSPEGYRHSY
jgi:feruloyl-CoA synthase